MAELTNAPSPRPGRPRAQDLLGLLFDDESWKSWDTPPDRSDASPEYLADLDRATTKSGVDESILTGEGWWGGRRVAVAAGEFGFLAGSVGRAAAQRLVTGIRRATSEGLPLVALPCSGGTRMQEGTPAFVLMAPIAAALRAHRDAGLAYVVYLRHPTTGGVMATWGSLGQVTYAEPGALIGFLGPRVFEALYDEPFPSGVQTSENLHAHGIIDAVVPHDELAETLQRTLAGMHSDRPAATPAGNVSERESEEDVPDVDAWDCVERTRRPDRPGVRDLLATIATEVVELTGTGEGEIDPGILLALVRLGGHRCVLVGQDREAQRHRPFGPAGLRTARRGMRLAAELGLPWVSVLDTPGAALSPAAEEGALAGEIARCLSDLSALDAPTLSLMLGEGNGGGALALLPTDRIVAAQHAWLSPLPPEGASVIVHRDPGRADEMTRAQQVRAIDLRRAGVVDRIIPERPDAADESDPFCRRVGSVLVEELDGLLASSAEDRAERRTARLAGW